jgi:hypothetical protein
MSIVRKYAVYSLLLAGVILFGCSSMGGVEISGDSVYISLSNNVANSPAKVQEIRERQFIETMHRYITHRFRKLKVRQSLQIHVSIESVRLRTSIWSAGADHMKVNVIVKENNKELKTFSTGSASTRSRDSATKAMSKDIAIKIYEQIKSL